jgi:DNA replication protein DnaC
MNSIKPELVKERMEELGLTFMAAGFDSFLSDQSRREDSLLEVLSDLVDLEYHPRKERMARTRLKVSGIPQHKKLEDFDLNWLKGGLTQKKFNELSSLSFIQRKENIILLGPSGLGKTHLLLALGHKACLNGFSAYYISCVDVLERLLKSREQGKLKRKLQWFAKPHVLLIDEVGYENLSPEQATLFFRLVNTRY